jgi:hypothetical protein
VNPDFVPSIFAKKNFAEAFLPSWNDNRVNLRWIQRRRAFLLGYAVFGLEVKIKQEGLELIDNRPGWCLEPLKC